VTNGGCAAVAGGLFPPRDATATGRDHAAFNNQRMCTSRFVAWMTGVVRAYSPARV